MPRHVILEIAVEDNASPECVSWIREAMGECARSLEAEAADGLVDGLIQDDDDPGRYTWRSFDRIESYEDWPSIHYAGQHDDCPIEVPHVHPGN